MNYYIIIIIIIIIIIEGTNFLYSSLHFWNYHLFGWNFVDNCRLCYNSAETAVWTLREHSAKSDQINLDASSFRVVLLLYIKYMVSIFVFGLQTL
jgi:hypothetical protein